MEFVAFDLETTGTQPNENAIVEIGAVRFSGSEPLVGFGKLINPGMPIPAEASRVNGITDEMVKDAPPIESIRVILWGIPLVAHNASFDFKFLLSDVKRLKRSSQGPVLDTLSLARKVFQVWQIISYGRWFVILIFRVAPFIVQKIVCIVAFCCELLKQLSCGESKRPLAPLFSGWEEAFQFRNCV